MGSSLTSLRIDPLTLDFDLPDELIAQEPVAERDRARLMVLDRQRGSIGHFGFRELPAFLGNGDVLVINTAQVTPAKLMGQKETGGRVEAILIGPQGSSGEWRALLRPEMKPGTRFVLGSGARVELVSRTASGENILRFQDGDPQSLIRAEGRLPLPPYIKRSDADPRTELDAQYYQTVYAQHSGSLAAPTAGLHFTPALLENLERLGVTIVRVLLHVGWGTFKPIAGSVADHSMLPERFELTPEAIGTLYTARGEGRRIVAVGTTATRVLESMPEARKDCPAIGETSLFIKPGYSFRWVSALITNFHVPRSTPVSLTASFAGLPFLESAYAAAIGGHYRFFSYGDAMMIL